MDFGEFMKMKKFTDTVCNFLEHIISIFRSISNIRQAATGRTKWPCKYNKLKSLAHNFHQQKLSLKFKYQCMWGLTCKLLYQTWLIQDLQLQHN